jgi:hypothetical protein
LPELVKARNGGFSVSMKAAPGTAPAGSVTLNLVELRSFVQHHRLLLAGLIQFR